MINGLSTSQALQNLKQYGFNELPSSQPKSIMGIAFEVLREPMFILLLSSGTLYLLLGNYQEGLILLSSIFVIIGITFYQYQKTERALQALKELSSPRALVIRDGKELRVPGKEVVPGDVLILNEGDRIAADASLLESTNLTIDESILTGESVAVVKSIDQEGHLEIFSGTLVVQGTGKAHVNSTGIHTQFGKIGVSLGSIEDAPTRLQVEMKTLVMRLTVIGGFASCAVVLAFYLSRGNLIKSLLSGLASAMALMPEEFPVVLTIFMALGAWRLSQKKVLTRKPSAIETLGSATVLCSDKTGTITQNKMEVAAVNNGETDLSLVNGRLTDTNFFDLLSIAARASQLNSIDPMERAIAKTFEGIASPQEEPDKLIKEYPLSKQLLAMTRVLRDPTKQVTYVSTKGAPEAILSLCKLDAVETAKHLKSVAKMASQGYRVLGVAEGVPSEPLPELQSGFQFHFKGLIALADPARPEVPDAIRQCSEAGVRVIMITGDYPGTAISIATQIGLSTEGGVLTGDELSAMSDTELKDHIGKTNVFARIVPEQKLRIVQALKARGEIVAMTGDGVNDAPALKAAHIGIAMGNRGTDVAREASSLVLLDDNFASIVGAIHSGRRIFDNLQKAMSYIMAIHIPIIGLTLLPAFFSSLPVLLLPLQIVFLELIIDPVCAIAFETEQDEEGIMKRKPRRSDESFFGKRRILSSVMTGALLFVSVLVVYFLSLGEGHTEGEVRAIAFSSLIFGNVFLTLTDLSRTRNFFSVILERNWAAIGILVLSIGMMVLTISVAALRSIFNFEYPGFSHFIPAFLCAVVVLVVLESLKYRRRMQAA